MFFLPFLAPLRTTLQLRSSSSLSGAAGVRRYFLMRSYAVTSHSSMDLLDETELKRSLLRLSFRNSGSLIGRSASELVPLLVCLTAWTADRRRGECPRPSEALPKDAAPSDEAPRT